MNTIRPQKRITSAEWRQMMGLSRMAPRKWVVTTGPPGVKSGPVSHIPNKTEQRYAQQLAALKACGGIQDYAFEPMKLRLAAKTWWTPDFAIILPDGRCEFHEVKAAGKDGKPRWRDDARVKTKIAADLYPQFRFVVTWLHGGSWCQEIFNAKGTL